MAWPGTPSTTGAATLGNTVPSWYNRVMLDWLVPELRFYTYAQKRPIPEGEGSSVIWNRKVTINEGYKASDGYPISAVKTLSTNKVSALIETLTDAVNVSRLARKSSIIDTDQYALEVLAQAAAKTVDKFVIHSLVADSVVRHYVKKLGSVIASNSAAVSACASLPRIALSDIRVAATYLEGMNAKPYDGMHYIGIMHPKHKSDIFNDGDFEAWTQYTTRENMLNFEIGRAYNVRFVQSTLVPVSTASAQGVALSVFTPSSVSTLAYATTIFGKDAYGVSELGGGVQTYVSKGASKVDPTDLTNVYGYAVDMAAKVINPSALTFIWAAVGDSISAISTMSERRNAGVTCDTDQIGAW